MLLSLLMTSYITKNTTLWFGKLSYDEHWFTCIKEDQQIHEVPEW